MVDWLTPPAPGSAGQVAQAFASRYGVVPDGVWSAPGRVNVIGEHTDYNAGTCLPMALPHRTFVAVRRREDDVVRIGSLQTPEPWEGRVGEIGPGRPAGWAGYAAGVFWALGEERGADVLVDGHVPVGAGLSSSAALSCSMASALAGLGPLGGADPDSEVDLDRLVQACIRAENEVVGASTGGMDQTVALRAVPGHVLLLDFADGAVEPVPWQLGDHTLLVVDTRAPHALADGQYAARRTDCESAAAALGVASLREIEPGDLGFALDRLRATDPASGERLARRTRHVVTEIERVAAAVAALRGGEVDHLGELMSASHASLRDDYEVSCLELDLVVRTALEQGAAGARMTGGGFGGSAVALVATELVEPLTDAVDRAFADAGLRPPGFLRAEPSGPARSERVSG